MMAIKPARWVWAVVQQDTVRKGTETEGARCTDLADVSGPIDISSVTFFDLGGVVYALPGICASCALVESRELTAEEKRICSKRSLHARPLSNDRGQHQGLMILLDDTGRIVAVSPASSHYGSIWEAD